MLRIIFSMFFGIAVSISAYSNKKIEHVIFVGIDGFSSEYLSLPDLPTLRRLMENGSYTLSKRSDLPSVSAPNWSSMFMGVPVEVHGYTDWASKTPEIPSTIDNLKNNIFPTMFQVVKETCPEFKLGCIYEWEGIKHLIDTVSCDYHEIAEEYLEHPNRLTDMACEYIKSHNPNLFAIIFDGLDHTGHTNGYVSE